MKRIVLVISILLLVAGCTTTDPAEGTDRSVAFVGGNVGVNLGLIQGTPPAAVYDGGRTDFGVGIVLANVGEADIGPGTENPFVRISLEDFLPSVFGLSKTWLVVCWQVSSLLLSVQVSGPA